MIEQRRPHLERMRHAGSIDLGQQTFGQIGIQIEPAQLRERLQVLAPILPIEPQVVVARGSRQRSASKESICTRRQPAERRGIRRQSDVDMALHRRAEARQRRQANRASERLKNVERAPMRDQ